MTGSVLVGTSGWYYQHWRGVFYPAELPKNAYLGYYADRFRTVELNNSFYRLPKEETFRDWATKVPEGFVFAVKASRTITHLKRLRNSEQSLGWLVERAALLGDRLGPLLFQLPPQFEPDLPRLEAFLELLPRNVDAAFEFRDRRWLSDELFALLAEHRIALCLDDAGDEHPPRVVTAELVYLRFHGPGKMYQGDYPCHDLEGWVPIIAAWVQEGRRVYCYFNNDPGGYAVKNAQEMRALLGSAGVCGNT